MRSIGFRLLCLIAIAGPSATANAAIGFQGTWGPFGASELIFAATNIAARKSNCVIGSNFGDNRSANYRISASQNNDDTDGFVVTHGSGDSLRVRLWYSDDDSPTEQELADGSELSTDFTGNTSRDCRDGTGVNAHLKVALLNADYESNSVPAGVYTGTVTMTERIWFFTARTTVSISVTVQGLVRITGLDNHLFNAGTWNGGDMIQTSAFCAFTNATSGNVQLTASTSSVYYHDGDSRYFGVLNEAGTATRRYNVQIREAGGAWTGDLEPGDSRTLGGGGANLTCGGGENMELQIRFDSGEIAGAEGGTYRGLLQLMLAPD